MHVLIQARMSSNRLPAKVLRKLAGKPLIQHITDNINQNLLGSAVIIVTSTNDEDNLIADFAKSENITCFRGSLDDVHDRFCKAIELYKIPHFVRICADSPLVDVGLIKSALKIFDNNDADIVTNVFPRTFPKGQSVEVIRSHSFVSDKYRTLPHFSAEHITQAFYRNKEKYHIVNIFNSHDQSSESLAVDTEQDFQHATEFLRQFNYPKYKLHMSHLKTT